MEMRPTTTRRARQAYVTGRTLLGLSVVLVSSAGAAPPQQPATQPAARVREYAPGVLIDWASLQVELDARVVLREGLLELFACSPRTREHESIVVVRARPLHIYQAMGLIGLSPGQPVTYDEAANRWIPASGDRVLLEVRYPTKNGPRTVNVWDWMMDAKKPDATAESLRRDWVFCGSRRSNGGVLGADVEGTIACVVDFDTALIGLAELHSADNTSLWLAARTENIPPEGSECTLLIRSAAVVVECASPGRFRLHGRWLTPQQLRTVLGERLTKEPAMQVIVRLLPGATADVASAALKTIRAAGVENVHLEEDPPPAPSSPARAGGEPSGSSTPDD